jgi:hypothetical protein
MDEEVSLNEKVVSLARLKIEVDLLKRDGRDHVRYTLLESKYNENYKELSLVVDCLKEKLKLEVVRIQGGVAEEKVAEGCRRDSEKVLLQENRLANVEGRLDSIDESLKKLLDLDSTAKASGKYKLNWAGWWSLTPEDRFLAFLYLLPAIIVLLLLCSAIYRVLLADSVDISVELNIAELIGGSLVGLGATLAGGAYAMKVYKDTKAE